MDTRRAVTGTKPRRDDNHYSTPHGSRRFPVDSNSNSVPIPTRASLKEITDRINNRSIKVNNHHGKVTQRPHKLPPSPLSQVCITRTPTPTMVSDSAPPRPRLFSIPGPTPSSDDPIPRSPSAPPQLPKHLPRPTTLRSHSSLLDPKSDIFSFITKNGPRPAPTLVLSKPEVPPGDCILAFLCQVEPPPPICRNLFTTSPVHQATRREMVLSDMVCIKDGPTRWVGPEIPHIQHLLSLSLGQTPTVDREYIKSISQVEALINSYPVPSLHCHLSKMYWHLRDPISACQHALTAQRMISPQVDEVLDRWISRITIKSQEIQAASRTPLRAGYRIFEPEPATSLPSTPERLQSSLDWTDNIKSSTAGTRKRKIDTRYIAIQSNILDDLYNLTTKSINNLVKHGIHSDHVIQNPHQYSRTSQDIIDILQDAISAIDEVYKMVEQTRTISVDDLIRLHWTATTNYRVSIKSHTILGNHLFLDGDGMLAFDEFDYIPAGLRTRDIWVHAYQYAHCRPATLISDLTPCMDMLNSILKERSTTGSCSDPFSKAAWIHHALNTIRPFDTGSGADERSGCIARLLASIPLIAAGIPPLVISTSGQKAYFKAVRMPFTDLLPLREIIYRERLMASQILIRWSARSSSKTSTESKAKALS